MIKSNFIISTDEGLQLIGFALLGIMVLKALRNMFNVLFLLFYYL